MTDPRLVIPGGAGMADQARLERRALQLTVLSAVFVLASVLAAFMYPLVFVHPEGNKWTLRVAFFGFAP